MLVGLVKEPSRSVSPCPMPLSFVCGEIEETLISAKMAYQVDENR